MQFICRYDIHTAQEPGSLFWYHAYAVVSLQFTKSTPAPAEADCETCERIVLLLIFIAKQ